MGKKDIHTQGTALRFALSSEDFSMFAAIMDGYFIWRVKHPIHYLDGFLFLVPLTSIGCVCQVGINSSNSLDERPLPFSGHVHELYCGAVLTRGSKMKVCTRLELVAKHPIHAKPTKQYNSSEGK